MNKTFVWLVVILIFALFSSFVYADTVTYKATSKVTTSIASTPAGVAISSSLDSAILDFFTNGLKGTLRRPNGSTFSTGDYRNAIISYVKEYYDIKVKPGTSAKGEATFEFTRKPNLTIKGSTPKTRSTRSSSVKTSKQIADLKLKLEQVAKATAEAKAEANVKITGNTGSAPAGKTIVINKIYINSADGRVTTVPITPGQPAPPAPAPNLVQVTRIAPTTTIINSAPIGATFSPFSNFNSNLTIANAINFSAPVVTTANITLPPGVTIPSGVILPPGYVPPAGINVIIIPQGSTIPAGITFPPGTTFHQNFTFNTFKITRVTVNQTNPPTNPTNTSKIPYKKIFKGSLLYALAVGADSVIVDYYSTDSDKINWKEVGIDAGLKAGKTFAIASVVGITIAKGASWAAARSSVAATIVKG
ncbi:MAG TPA: hypothetical protein PKK60_01535 [archaeon]|nr:hypothetical protein [archaeon]